MSVVFENSFSGADADVYGYYSGLEAGIVPLKAIQTVSISVHEAKGQVRSLGFRGIRGITRSIRTVGGSIICIVLNDHPLRDLMVQAANSPLDAKLGWSLDRYEVGVGTALQRFEFMNRLATMLPPFNLLIQHVSETSNANRAFDLDPVTGKLTVQGCAELIVGVELVDSGKVTSINDIVTEITYSYIARDYKELATNQFGTEVELPMRTSAQDQAQEAQLQALLRGGGMLRGSGGTARYFDDEGNEISSVPGFTLDSVLDELGE